MIAIVLGLLMCSSAGAFAYVTKVYSAPGPRPGEMHHFLTTVDRRVDALRIAGNPYKFIGKHVSLWGSIGHIIDRHAFNLEIGGYDPTRYFYLTPRATVVVLCDSTLHFEWGATAHVLGTVVEPNLGLNVFGGRTRFPTLEASYIEIFP